MPPIALSAPADAAPTPSLTPPPTRRGLRASLRRRSPLIAWLAVIAALAGSSALTYPHAASWVSQLNQSAVVESYDESLSQADIDEAEQIARAHRYNEALSSGVLLAPGANVPQGSGSTTSDGEFDYNALLAAPNDVMARLQIPKIGVDLPVYHGTSDDTLLRGAGHLEGTSLPVGGPSTHAVITAHRGLAEATMFSNLDQIGVGDQFTLSVFGEVISYSVISTQVVAPEDTQTLRQEEGRDLVTLITCTPLGINSHRILVTGERITPTPPEDIEAATGPVLVGFPWWAVVYAASLVLIGLYAWWIIPTRRRSRR